MKLNLILLSLSLASLAAAELPAREIIEQHIDRHTLPDETTVLAIKLIDRKGAENTQHLRRLRKTEAGGLIRSLVVYDAPADIKGTALLTRENEGQSNDQWLYFPSRRRLQRIAQGRRSGYFMGTDFTYEDMDPEKPDQFSYAHLPEERIGDHLCYVIEARPADKQAARASGYGKRELWIRKDILFCIQVKFYDRQERLIKTRTHSDLVNLHGEVWRANRSFVDNLDKNHQTEVRITERDVRTEIPDDIFRERHITTGRYMK